MNLAGGTLLNNRYRIEKLLGQGGFGAVYQAWDMLKNRPCAVKVNLDPSPEAARQFEREARTLARLQHKNLPEVIDHFTRPGQGQFLVMQFIEGEDLESLVNRQGAISEAQVLPWLEQIAAALDYLHSQQPPIIHRDVKPANIRITNAGQAVLVDFGLVKVYDPQLRTTLGARAVTPGYSPPEQYGQSPTDARSDIYALGATAYTLLTGRESPESTQRAIHDSLRPAHEVNPQLSQHVSQAIAQAMSINPAGRFESAGAFYAALATPPPIISPLIPPPQRDQAKIGHTHFEKVAPAPPAAPAPAGPPAKAPPGSDERIKWVAYGVLALIMVGLPLLMSLFLLRNPITPPAGIGQTAAAEQATSGSQATSAAQVSQTTAANETATGRVRQTAVALTQTPPSATPTSPPSATPTSPPPTPEPDTPTALPATATPRPTQTPPPPTSTPLPSPTPLPAMATANALLALVANAPPDGPALGGELNESNNFYQSAERNRRNFIMSATFTNPTSSGWIYGFYFRAANNQAYRLDISSAGTWTLLYVAGDVETPAGGGILTAFVDRPAGINILTLVVEEDRGRLIVNNRVQTLSLSLNTPITPGDLGIISASRTPITFSNFQLKLLPEN